MIAATHWLDRAPGLGTLDRETRRQLEGIHPITKEPTTFKAKPASVQVKVRPLKKMKDMAQ